MSSTQTPIPVIAQVSRIVTSVVDRITGDRADFPLLVAAATVEALKNHGIESRVMYGKAAWVEVLDSGFTAWAGCWGENVHIWAATSMGEVVDLNTSVAHRRRAGGEAHLKALHSPPMVWAADLPKFYRYIAEGVAELELSNERDRKWFELVQREIQEKCRPELVNADDPEFPNEPILCPGRKLLDDSSESFKHYDRMVSVLGLPDPPF